MTTNAEERVIRRACRTCSLPVFFVDSVRSPNGSRRPLEQDLRTYHKCELPTRQEIGAFFNSERLALDAIDYISKINNRLEGFYLKLERVPK